MMKNDIFWPFYPFKPSFWLIHPVIFDPMSYFTKQIYLQYL